ncbi:MAG: asparagine synthase (glutamine-hydrolyzing) [Bacillota bacterium]|nr:asparagine synthase (glutamine-hydrolyzing) [Bacillota bacterium]
MCGIAGFINLNSDIRSQAEIIKAMTETLKKRGPDDGGFYFSKHALLGHRRLVVVDPSGGAQPMTKTIGNSAFTIVYNGELYNTEDVRKILLGKGYTFKSYSDTEVLLTAYIEWGKDCVNYINGIYAFGVWNDKDNNLFLARDPLGVKPLFYSFKNDTLIFGSEIKTLLAHPMIEPVVTKEGLSDIFGLGPARSLGNGIFKDISEVPPAHYLFFDSNKITLKEYWTVKSEPHTESFEETSEHVRTLLIDAITRQLGADVPVCTFLSGGLDSSIISAVASTEFKKKGKILDTYSIDYVGNDIYFKPTEFQPNSDEVWAEKMSDFIQSNHHKIVISTENLLSALKDAVLANDLPGMADIDSSLFLFCKEVRKNAVVSLSGECADELFGGYPWFRNPEYINSNTFPWSRAVKERCEILSKDLGDLHLEEYVASKYDETLKKVPRLDGESPSEHRMRELFYLNIKWFMMTLLNRKDRMSMSNSLEVRVPFADYRIVEYAFNIPMDMKYYKDREKGLLRYALKGLLPKEIVERKKSPYPKTHNPKYTEIVQNTMRDILNDKNSPILQLVDFNKIKEITETEGRAFKKPWYGQLMTGPQLLAYMIQINTWLKEYKIRIV